MKRIHQATFALAGLAAAAALAWAFAPRPIEVETAPVTSGRFESSIEEDGRTRLRDRYAVSAPLAGRLARIQLREGDAVAAGQPLAVIAPALPPMLDERSLREQAARLEAARSQQSLADARVGRARISVSQAQAELARTERLAKEQFASPNKLETDRFAEQAAKAELTAALEQTRVAAHEVEQARAALVAARGGEMHGGFVVKAPIEGRVLKVHQASEAAVPLGAPLLDIGDTRRLEVVVELLTTDALQAPPGSQVSIERWGGPRALQGVVRLVEPAGFTKISALGVEEQRVEALVDITSEPSAWGQLGDGYRVSARIVTRAVDGAVKLPVGAVFPLPRPDGAARHAAFVVEDGHARKVPVEVQARNGEEAWIAKGLRPGDTVIVYPPPAVRDGARVSSRKPGNAGD